MRDCLATIADRSTAEGIPWPILTILLFAILIAYIGYDLWRAGHTANTDRRQFNTAKTCELCGHDDVSVCPSCAYALRAAFLHGDQVYDQDDPENQP